MVCVQMKSLLSKTFGSSSAFNISFIEDLICECVVICIHNGTKTWFSVELKFVFKLPNFKTQQRLVRKVCRLFGELAKI